MIEISRYNIAIIKISTKMISVLYIVIVIADQEYKVYHMIFRSSIRQSVNQQRMECLSL